MATIAEIGTNRLINVLVRDKNQSPARTLAILKSEITALLESYLELDDEINIKMEESLTAVTIVLFFTFKINATAVRVKDFGTVFD